MSKFIKRIQKSVRKHVDTAIVVGSDQKNIENIINGFNTVFCVNYQQQLPKYKNIITIQENTFLNELQNIDIVFLNINYDSDIFQFIPHLTRKCTPDIFLHNDLVLSTEYIDFFKRIRYEQITILDDYQIWKVIRR
jgi:hypothetical protein